MARHPYERKTLGQQFVDGVAGAIDSIRHEVVERGWFGREVTGDAVTADAHRQWAGYDRDPAGLYGPETAEDRQALATGLLHLGESGAKGIQREAAAEISRELGRRIEWDAPAAPASYADLRGQDGEAYARWAGIAPQADAPEARATEARDLYGAGEPERGNSASFDDLRGRGAEAYAEWAGIANHSSSVHDESRAIERKLDSAAEKELQEPEM